MMQKEKKTTAELVAMVIAEARKYPECSDVESVAITRPAGVNWDIAVTRHGGRISEMSLLRMQEIAAALRNRFDLA